MKTITILYNDSTKAIYEVDYLNIMENEINFPYQDNIMHIPFSSMKWYQIKGLSERKYTSAYGIVKIDGPKTWLDKIF